MGYGPKLFQLGEHREVSAMRSNQPPAPRPSSVSPPEPAAPAAERALFMVPVPGCLASQPTKVRRWVLHVQPAVSNPRSSSPTPSTLSETFSVSSVHSVVKLQKP